MAAYGAFNMLSIVLEGPYAFTTCLRIVDPYETDFTGMAVPLHQFNQGLMKIVLLFTYIE